MAVVVDTDVVSFVFKNNSYSAKYKSHLDGEFMYLSFMSLAELRKWALISNWGARKNANFEIHLRRYSIVHSTSQLCQLWAEISDAGKRSGINIAVGDAWIAAAALFFDVPLVTHNRKHFQNVPGLTVISES